MSDFEPIDGPVEMWPRRWQPGDRVIVIEGTKDVVGRRGTVRHRNVHKNYDCCVSLDGPPRIAKSGDAMYAKDYQLDWEPKTRFERV